MIGKQRKAGFIETLGAKEEGLEKEGFFCGLCGCQEQGHLPGKGGEAGQNGYPCNLNCK